MVVFSKIVLWIKENISKNYVSLFLILFTLILIFVSWPLFQKRIQKKSTNTLNLSSGTIPFLITEIKNENNLNNTIYLGFWDLLNNKLYWDDIIPICDLEGEIGHIFWTGNKQLIICPTNKRSKINIAKQNPEFSIKITQDIDFSSSIIKPSINGKKIYNLIIEEDKSKLVFIRFIGKKVMKIEQTEIKEYPEVKFYKPISIIPNDFNPIIYCFYENKNYPEKGLGILQGTVTNRTIKWKIWKECDKEILQNNISYSNYFKEEIIISDSRTIQINKISAGETIKDLLPANNYFKMFRYYLFGKDGSDGFIREKDVILKEEYLDSPDLSVYKNILFMNWQPHFISNQEYYIKQTIALDGQKVIGRLEVLGDKIRIFNESILISEEIGDSRLISSRWIFPDY